jgi:hypothetical protein
VGKSFGELLDTNQPQDVLHPRGSLAARNARRLENEPKVPFDTQVRPECQILKYEPDTAPVWRYQAAAASRHATAVQPDLTFVRRLETGNEPQQGRLAAPARSEDHDDLPGRNL